MLSHFSRVQLCVTLWTAAHQAPPSMGFSKQEYWSGVPLPSPLITLSLLQNVQGLWRAPSTLLFEEEYWGAGVGAERLIFMFLAFAFSPKDAQKPPLSSKNVLGASLFQRFPLKIDNWERIQNAGRCWTSFTFLMDTGIGFLPWISFKRGWQAALDCLGQSQLC